MADADFTLPQKLPDEIYGADCKVEAIKPNSVFCRLEATRKELNSAWDHFIEIDAMTRAVMALIEKADDSDQSIIAARSVLSHICQLCEEYADEVDTAEVEVLKLQKEASHA
jgi:hypothetical protein